MIDRQRFENELQEARRARIEVQMAGGEVEELIGYMRSPQRSRQRLVLVWGGFEPDSGTMRN